LALPTTRLAISGSEVEVKTRTAALAEASCDEIAIQIVPGQDHPIEDWAHSSASSPGLEGCLTPAIVR
jgi:hypothetical protein